MSFIVEEKLFETLDDAVFGVLIVKGIDNSIKYDFINELLDSSCNEVYDKFKDLKVKEDYRIEPYRDAFRSLGMNPNKFMCSIEALVSRVAKGNKLPSINPIVDLTNAISLKYLIPLGAHNIDSFDGDIELRYTNGNDCFIPINKTIEEAEYPENELVYVSGNDIKTRRWTWRQGNNGKIAETTSNIFIPLDGFKNLNQEELVKARDELALIFKNQLNAKVQVGLVDKDNNIYNF